MFKRILLSALALGLGWGAIALTQDRGPLDRDAERIAELVRQLGSEKYAEREKAKMALEGIGAPALELLKKAVNDENLETSKRAQELVGKISDRILTAELLHPKRVRLNVKDQPVMEVVAELSRLSGYNLQVNGDRAGMAEKKITLDTGEVTFWEALDKLCAQAGMNEQIVVAPSSPIFRPPGIRPVFRPGVRPIRIKGLPAPIAPPGIVPGVLPVAPVPDAPVPDVPALPIQAPPENGAAFAVDEPARPEPAKPAPPVQADKPVAAPVGKVVVAPGGVIQVFPALPPLPPLPPGGIGGFAPGFPGMDPIPGGLPGTAPGQIQLIPGEHKAVPTSYAGSVRVRALSGKNLPAGITKGPNPTVVLDAGAEPRLQGFQVVGTPTILKAIDDQGQELTISSEAPMAARPFELNADIMIFPTPFAPTTRQHTVTFKKGEKASKLIKELSGTLTAQVSIPNEVVVKMENVMAAAGKTANGAGGGSLTVDSIEKKADGSIQAKLRLENLQPNPFGGMGGGIMINGAIQVIEIRGGGIAIGGGAKPAGMPDLVDARGHKYTFGGVSSMRTSINNGQITQEATVLYRPTSDTGDAASLVVFGNRTVNVQVPFSFKDVPLE